MLIVETKDGKMNRYLITTRHNIQLQRINNLVWYNLNFYSKIIVILLIGTLYCAYEAFSFLYE